MNEDSLASGEVKDIFDDAPFSSFLTALPGDIGVSQKNIYSLKKLINDPKVEKILTSKQNNNMFFELIFDYFRFCHFVIFIVSFYFIRFRYAS